jgi:hypothetical protein
MQVPHNRTFVALGTGLLWVGWFGFNGGSAIASNSQAAFALVNSSIAASVAMVTWMCIEWVHIGKPTLIGSCIGAIAGLATITPAAGFVRPWAGFLIGFITAFGCYGCVQIRDILKWDDALDVWGVHGMGGLFGTLLLGALADQDIGGQDRSGLFFGKQLAACVGTAAYSFIVSYVLLLLVNLVTPIVPDANEMAMGLDVSLHGEQAYDDEALDLSKSSPKDWDVYGGSNAFEGPPVQQARAIPVQPPVQPPVQAPVQPPAQPPQPQFALTQPQPVAPYGTPQVIQVQQGPPPIQVQQAPQQVFGYAPQY